MIKKAVINGFICIFVLSLFTEIANSADPKTNLQLEDIISQEGELIKTEIGKAEAVQAQMKEEEQRYIATNDLLKGAENRWKRDNTELQMRNMQIVNAINTHNSNRCMQESCNASYNANAARLNAKNVQVGKDFDFIEERRQGLITRRNDLSRAVLDLTQRMKRNNADLRDLYAKLQKWTNKTRALENCLNIPGIGDFERRLDGASEKAHRCLQQFFDGAR